MDQDQQRDYSEELYNAHLRSGEYEHDWGPVEHARLTGNPHRKCQIGGCRVINLDLDDEDDDEYYDGDQYWLKLQQQEENDAANTQAIGLP